MIPLAMTTTSFTLDGYRIVKTLGVVLVLICNDPFPTASPIATNPTRSPT